MGGILEGKKEVGYKKKKKLKKQRRADVFLGEEEKLEKRKKNRGFEGLTGEGRVRGFLAGEVESWERRKGWKGKRILGKAKTELGGALSG